MEEEMNEEIMSLAKVNYKKIAENQARLITKEDEEKGEEKEDKYKPKKLLTKHGINMFLALSQIQKSIRRGETEKAMQWAYELLEENEEGRNYEGQLWNRLITVAFEDCAGLMPVLTVIKLKELYFDWKKKENKKDSVKMLCLKTARELALCKKDRTADDYMIYRKESECTLKDLTKSKIKHISELKADDVAKDKHTQEGRKKGRTGEKGWAHFFHEGAKLVNESENYNKKYIEELKKAYPCKEE